MLIFCFSLCLSVLVVKKRMKNMDEKFMRRAIELALKGAGRTSPNPVVGAVVVKNGRIVGEGYHRRAGEAHAEIVALRSAGSRARGADIYITLEPCCHYGRTPPCCDSIIRSGVKRVIVGMRDPNPLVKGKGIRILKGRKINVTEGVLKKECRKIIAPYIKWIVSGIPFVTLKVALSLDGKIATESGDSKWITNDLCRNYVHELRDKADAVLIGVGTALKDDPLLTVRLPGVGPKTKPAIVLDDKLILSKTSKLFKRRDGKLIIATTSRAPKSKIKGFGRHKILFCRQTGDGRIFLPHLLEQLGAMGITSILVEGGGEVYSDFLRRGLADHVVACIAPKIIGSDGREWLQNINVNEMRKVFQLSDVNVRVFGDNVVLEGNLKNSKNQIRNPKQNQNSNNQIPNNVF